MLAMLSVIFFQACGKSTGFREYLRSEAVDPAKLNPDKVEINEVLSRGNSHMRCCRRPPFRAATTSALSSVQVPLTHLNGLDCALSLLAHNLRRP
jgi:hypothetical protein